MNLPSDVLVNVFPLVDTHDVDQKFKLSQVCKLWRAATLSTSSLWARITVATSLDARRMQLVMQRSDSQLLDIELPWYDNFRPVALSMDDRAVAVDELGNHCQRIKRLVLKYDAEDTPGLRDILASGRDFPHLEDLEIEGGGFALALTAPCLRFLVLENQQVEDWTGLLSSSLEQLEALNGVVDSDLNILHTFFRGCPALKDVSLHVDGDGFDEFTLPATPALHTLHLQAAEGRDIAAVLRSGFPSHTISHVSTCTLYGDIQDLSFELLRGLDRLVSLIAYTGQDIEFHDAVGRTRRVELSHEDVDGFVTEVWSELVAGAHAHKTLQCIDFNAYHWTCIAETFEMQPPENELLDIYVRLDTEDVEDVVFNQDGKESSVMRRIICPTLRKVVFLESTMAGKQAADLVRKLLLHLDCSRSRVEVCLCKALIGSEELTSLEHDFPTLRTSGEWVLCKH